jgi:hypothetical protein
VKAVVVRNIVNAIATTLALIAQQTRIHVTVLEVAPYQ